MIPGTTLRDSRLDCLLETPWRYSRKARHSNSELSPEQALTQMKFAYNQKPNKYVPGANSLVNQMLAKKKSKSRKDRINPSRSGSATVKAGGSFLEGSDSVQESLPSFAAGDSVTAGNSGFMVEEGSIGTVGSILRDYSSALADARQRDQDKSQLKNILSPVQTNYGNSRDSTITRVHMTRNRTPNSPAIFSCRYDGCGKQFRIAKDLFIHECQVHSDMNPRNIFIPVESTISADIKRCSTANNMRLPPSRAGCSGLRPPVPIARPSTAQISVDVLQQRRKWEEFTQIGEWGEHRKVLEEYRRKLDVELGKTRPRLPMGPLALRAKLALVKDEDDWKFS